VGSAARGEEYFLGLFTFVRLVESSRYDRGRHMQAAAHREVLFPS
jgi:hypothetical protein